MTIVDVQAPDPPLVFVNDAFLNMTGHRREEVMGRNCRFLQGSDTDPAAVGAIAQATGLGKAVNLDVLNYRKDGQPFWNALQSMLSRVSDRRGAQAAVPEPRPGAV